MYKQFHHILRDREEISVRYDPKTAAIWCYFNPKERPCYSYKMLVEINELQLEIIDYFHKNNMKPKIPIRFIVWASQTDGVFNYGGDLKNLEKMVVNQDKDTLLIYGDLATKVIYRNYVNLELPLITIAVVEGIALGGGFEAVLSSNVSIVEKQVKMGITDIRFNLFAGAGAYSILARSIGVKNTEEIMTSGKIYNAQALYDMGLLTKLVSQGCARKEANIYMEKYSKMHNGMTAIASSRNRYMQVEFDELMDICKIWVNAAMNLEQKDLKLIRKLVEMQTKKKDNILYKNRTMQDRRINLSKEMITPFNERRKVYNRRNKKVS